MAAALDEAQKPEAEAAWQPVWKRLWTPKRQLHTQRLRSWQATKRRLVVEQSRRPRSRQSRLGNEAARHDVRALSRCGTPASGCGDDAPIGSGDGLTARARHRLTTGTPGWPR